MNSYDFFIAELAIRLEVPWHLPDSPAFSPFRGDFSRAELNACLSVEESLPPIPEGFFSKVLTCHGRRDGARLCYHLEGGEPFALTEYEKGRVNLRIKKGFEHYFSSLSAVFNRIDFENILPDYNRFLLHASLCEKDGKAILFIGPSGAGKSTQAGLWETLRGWRVLNGDRAVLYQTSRGFFAYGSPWAGSSSIRCNEKGRVALAALPEHAIDNATLSLSPGDAFHKIFPHLSLGKLYGETVERAMALCADFVGQVPTVRLFCRPDEGAVTCLEEVLP